MSKSNVLVLVGPEINVPDVGDVYSSTLDYEFFENFASEHTKIAYRSDLKQFFKFVLGQFGRLGSVADLKRTHVIAYRNYLQSVSGRGGKPCCPKTVIRKLAAISSYCDFLVEKSLLGTNPTSSVMRPTDQVITQTNDLSDDQVKKLIEVVDTSKPVGLLHKAILTLMFSTGIRKSELIHLKLEDYREHEGFKIIQFIGKRGKLNRVPLHPTASYHLDLYIQSMRRQGKLKSSTEPLFQPTRNHSDPGNTDKHLTPSSIDFIIQKYCRKIGVTTHITPHSARASVIGSLLEHGCDLYRVSQMVNHSSVKTTQSYDKRGKKLSDSPVFHLKFF